jgi:ABC-type transport system involved in multi-copper enzyme maturation permease subunit
MAVTTPRNVGLSAPGPDRPAGLRGAIASELTKIRSIRSTYWTLAALLVVSVGLDAGIAAGTAASMSSHPANKAGFDSTQLSLGAFFEIGQLIITVLGALSITAEYSTGMIRTSLTAQPRRGVVYGGKVIVIAAVAFIVSLITSFAAFLVGQALLSSHGVSASLFHSVTIPQNARVACLARAGAGGPGGCARSVVNFSGTDVISPSAVLAAIFGTALFVTLVAVIAFGVGAIVRHTAGTVSIVIAALFIVPILEVTLPDNWHWDIMRLLPDAADQVVTATVGPSNPHLWSAWPQLGVTALWAAALVAAGAYLFRKRDA